PVRLVGVGYAGLSAIAQDTLFPELDRTTTEETGPAEEDDDEERVAASGPATRWTPGADVHHPEFGHGWVQGAGHGVVTVRFETRSTGPGPARTLDENDPDLDVADPLASLN